MEKFNERVIRVMKYTESEVFGRRASSSVELTSIQWCIPATGCYYTEQYSSSSSSSRN